MEIELLNIVRNLHSLRSSHLIERRCDHFEDIIENNLKDSINYILSLSTSSNNTIESDFERLIIKSGFIQSIIYTYLQSCLSQRLKELTDKDDQLMNKDGRRGRRGKRFIPQTAPKGDDIEEQNSDLDWNESSSRIIRLTIELIALICERSLSNIEYLEHIIDRIDVILSVLNDGILTDLFKSTVLRHKLAFAEGEKKIKSKKSPPENFRLMPLIPALSEIKSSRNLYLQANLKYGSFDNVEHYLDTHFRLLREDYVGSIREGLIEYLDIERINRLNFKNLMNIRVYKNVSIINSVTDNQCIVHLIGFQITDRMQRIRWETSKRLIDGSLLCFSNDNFKTAYFATVFDRYAPDLYDGKIIVKFDDWISLNNNVNDYNNKFVMIESLAYFESYRHTLDSLKTFDEMNFPFKQHIVYSQNESIDKPKYLRERQNVFYDFRPMIENAHEIEVVSKVFGYYTEKFNILVPDKIIKNFKFKNFSYSTVNLNEQRTWPTSALLGLDSSQYEAIKSALTHELVVIQGPPGTGKTYIGVEFIKMLLHNYDKISPMKPKSRNWNPDETDNPILIVCYTNHALDQILMLVSKFLNEGVNEIVRIGGRSKEDALIGANLKNIRSCHRHFRKFPKRIITDLTIKKKNLKNLINEINASLKLLNEATMKILDFSEVCKMCNSQVFERFFDNTVRQFYDCETLTGSIENRIFKDWLGAGNLENWFNRKNLIDSISYFNAPFIDNKDDNTLNDAFEGMNIRESDEEESEEFSDANDRLEFPEVRPYEYQSKNNNATEEAEMINQFRQLDDDIEKKINIRQLMNDKNNLMNAQIRKFKYKKSKKNPSSSNFEFLWRDRNKARINRLIDLLSDSNSHLEMSEHDVNRVRDLWQMAPQERLMFYKYFLNKYRDRLNNNLNEMREEYAFHEAELKKARDIESLFLLRNAKIIGCTTTGAAKNQSLLQLVKPKIVIAEEAAEVFESHIITCLTPSCEQLILIGDNEQLRPKPNLYKLETDYNLNVSLFERLVNNKIPKVRLDLQHRMRPEISFLMKYFYENLIDAKTVMNYENVTGVEKDVFFIQHENQERSVEDSTSKSNLYEAEYLSRFCDYLIKQDYKPEQITILVAYGGQVTTMKNQVAKLCDHNTRIHPSLRNVRITPIDNYQGEENDIVLLSLVRSNKNNSIGFLDVSNRVCVALSRAKKGFYVIADFNHLANNSKLWSSIVTEAKSREIIGKTLNVVCKKHDTVTEINKVEDFDLCPDGGCLEICNEELDCGHLCDMKCHTLDHTHFNCVKKCERLHRSCSMDHKCNLMCFEECVDCMFNVEKFLPTCGHTVNAKCSTPTELIECSYLIRVELECGHFKDLQCHILRQYQLCLAKPLGNVELYKKLKASHLKCETIVEKCFEPCNHITDIACHLLPETIECKTKISKIMPNCGHSYAVECSKDQSTVECKAKVEVKLNCEHTAVIDCSSINTSYITHYKCLVEKNKNFKCGHEATLFCHEYQTATCQKLCKKSLSCGHECHNKCGLCGENNAHSICNVKCNKMLLCGHICSLRCSVPCYTCTENCTIKCPHRDCSRKCSELCAGQCIKQCAWSCKHNAVKCNKQCNEYCNAPRCNVKCDIVLECSHKCQSLCGETCFCRECSPETAGLEETKTFIKLGNCKCIIDVDEMDKHMLIEQFRLKLTKGFPICPKCHKALYYSKRYANIIQPQHEKLLSLQFSTKINNKTRKRRFFIYHQAIHIPIDVQAKIDEYMKNISSNLQLTFVENRIRLFKFHRKQIVNRFEYCSGHHANDVLDEIMDAPIEIPNEKAEELAGRVIACYYYYTLNETNNHKAIANKIRNDLLERKIFSDDYFQELLMPVVEHERPKNFEIFRLETLILPIKSIYL